MLISPRPAAPRPPAHPDEHADDQQERQQQREELRGGSSSRPRLYSSVDALLGEQRRACVPGRSLFGPELVKSLVPSTARLERAGDVAVRRVELDLLDLVLLHRVDELRVGEVLGAAAARRDAREDEHRDEGEQQQPGEEPHPRRRARRRRRAAVTRAAGTTRAASGPSVRGARAVAVRGPRTGGGSSADSCGGRAGRPSGHYRTAPWADRGPRGRGGFSVTGGTPRRVRTFRVAIASGPWIPPAPCPGRSLHRRVPVGWGLPDVAIAWGVGLLVVGRRRSRSHPPRDAPRREMVPELIAALVLQSAGVVGGAGVDLPPQGARDARRRLRPRLAANACLGWARVGLWLAGRRRALAGPPRCSCEPIIDLADLHGKAAQEVSKTLEQARGVEVVLLGARGRAARARRRGAAVPGRPAPGAAAPHDRAVGGLRVGGRSSPRSTSSATRARATCSPACCSWASSRATRRYGPATSPVRCCSTSASTCCRRS